MVLNRYIYTLFPIHSSNFFEAPDPSISYNLIGELKSVQLIEVKYLLFKAKVWFVFVSDLDKVRRDLYRARVRPTARTGLLLLKYLKTTYRLETREGPGAATQRETEGWEGKGREGLQQQ